MSEDIYTKFGIYKSRLKRDYIENPLQKIKINTPTGYKWEYPYKEDLEYLYLELNLPILILSHFFQISKKVCYKLIKLYNLIKSKSMIAESTKKTNQLLYGVESYTQTDEYKRKYKETCLKKYGVESFTKSDTYHQKSIDTCLKKYGVKHYSETNECRKKVKQTLKERYGDENYVNVKKFKETCLKKYGVSTTALLPDVIKKKQETCLKKYGTISYQQSEHHKSRVSEIMEKQYNTKRKHNTFTTSNNETIILNSLKSIYTTVLTQYKSQLYPFRCDFYIPEIDTYIEYQGHWTHGKEPYMGTDEQKEKIKLWEDKQSKFYNGAIDVWTKRDPLKRETAKKNNLNWLEFFTMDEFMQWLYNH